MIDVQDIFVPESRLEYRVREVLSSRRSNLRNYRSKFVIEDESDLTRWVSGVDAAKYLIARAKHKQLIIDRFPMEIANILNASKHPQSYGDYAIHTFGGGLASGIKTSDLYESSNGYVKVPDAWLSFLAENFSKLERRSTSEYSFFEPDHNLSDGDVSLLAKAYAKARRELMYNSNFYLSSTHLFSGSYLRQSGLVVDSDYGNDDHIFMSLSEAISLSRMIWASSNLRPSRDQIMEAKRVLVNELASSESRASRERKMESRQNFAKYWQEMKSRAEMFAKGDEILASFSTIPMLPAGTPSSRTWGIEVEVVQDNLVSSRPSGWKRTGDGSLEGINDNDDGYCDCGCDDCDDGSHCGYDECQGDNSGNTAEYVSPILRSFNSAGLRSLCNDLDGTEVNTTPGIHIHVGADGLNPADIARLLAAYSAISPFIWPLMERETRNYCRDVTTDNIAYWLGKAREWRNTRHSGTEPWVSWNVVLSAVNEQPDDRYRDINLQALHAHGTVEFRAMGPIYNYDRLVRWAWLCREMMNISKIDIPQSAWTNIRSMADIVRLLRQFGMEQLPENATKLYEQGDDLSVELYAEANR